MNTIEIQDSKLSRFLFTDTRFAWFWLVVRVYVGYEWLMAGWGKLGNPAWTGANAGSAIGGFLNGALQKTAGAHPDVAAWYAYFIQHIALPNAALFSYLVTFGELAVGIALILGLFTGIAAFSGAFMNLNYLFAGTVSTNAVLFFLQILIVLAWKTAGWIGVDRYALFALGTPWQPGRLFRKEDATTPIN